MTSPYSMGVLYDVDTQTHHAFYEQAGEFTTGIPHVTQIRAYMDMMGMYEYLRDELKVQDIHICMEGMGHA